MSEEIRGAHRLVAHHDAERERKATARPLESGEWIARSAYRVDPAPRALIDEYADFFYEKRGL